MTTTLEYHQISNLLPMPSEGEQQLLKDSIQKDGLLDPIVIYDGKIIDGRSRYEACVAIGIPPITRQYSPERDGASPTSWVLAKNLFRRHLNAGQRAAVSMAAMPHFEAEAKERQAAAQFGSDTTPTTPAMRSAEAAADAAQVSPGTVKRAKKLAQEAPDLHEQVLAGTITLNQGIKTLDERKAAQDDLKSQDPDDEETQTRNAIAQENIDALTKALGDDFAKSVRDTIVLKTTSELQDFIDLSHDEQRLIKELVIRKWSVKKALEFHNAAVKRGDKIQDLFVRTLSAGGSKMAFEIDGWHIVVSRRKNAVTAD